MRTLPALLAASMVTLACSDRAAPDETSSGGGSGGSGAPTGGTAGSGTQTGGAAGNGAGTQGGAGGGSSAVTWSEHVAPIVYRECVGCHRDGGIAPFSLTTYASAAESASSIAYATGTRYMPPMPVDNSGSCNTYSNARWLSDAEIATIGAWDGAGAPEGDPSLAPELPAAPAGLERIDLHAERGTQRRLSLLRR
jgi:hypothetical protein